MYIAEIDNVRIDVYLSEKLDISRSKIQKLIKENKVLVNDKEISNNYKLKINDKIKVNDDLDFNQDILPVKMDLNIIYEDNYFMIINKPSGLVVHPAPGHYNDTLVNGLLYYFNIEKTNNYRLGLPHRLDKDTSGLMLIAKDEKTLELLSKMISDKEIKRHYLAITDGVIKENTAKINAPIGRDTYNRQKQAVTDINSKQAVTNIKVLERFKNNTYIECILETGRTHQIRVHLSYIGYPVNNDPVYNKKKATEFGQMLHSYLIEFKHPYTKEIIKYEIEPPKAFKEKLKELKSE